MITIPIGIVLILLGIILIIYLINKKQKSAIIEVAPQVHKQTPITNPYTRGENVRSVQSYTPKDDFGSKKTFPNYCPYCGIKLEREARFCHECGTQLDE